MRPAWPCAPLLPALLLLAGIAQAAPTLRITGGDEDAQANIRAHVEPARESCELPEWRERALLRKAARDTAAALRALGWYAPGITTRIVRDPECWTLSIDVAPGNPVIVTQTDIRITGEAADDSAFTALAASPPLRTGDRLHHGIHDDYVREIQRLAESRGYLDGAFTLRELRVNVAEESASILLHFDSGPRHHIGELRLVQDVLDEDFVDRLHRLTPGTPYDAGDLVLLRRDLLDSGHFDEVRIRTLHDETIPGEISVEAELIPRPAKAWFAGIGYATDIGPRLRLGHEHRRVNRRGHSMNSELEISPVRSGIGLTYEIPLKNPRTSHLSLTGSFRTEDNAGIESNLLRLGGSRRDHLPSDWVLSRGLDFEREDFTIGDDRGYTNLLMPSVGLAGSRSEETAFARSGWRLDLRLRGALEDVGSDLSLLQGRARAVLLLPAGKGRLILRGEAGSTLADEFRELPASVRFFTGGDTSVRGYGYQKIGPRDDSGTVIGGRHLLTAGLEYERPVKGAWSVAVFTDAGDAFNAFDGLKTSVGVGLRWHSPVGTLRVDLAHPFDDGDAFRLHIGLGVLP